MIARQNISFLEILCTWTYL